MANIPKYRIQKSFKQLR